MKGIVEIRRKTIKEGEELDYAKRYENSVSFLAHGIFDNQKWVSSFTLDKIQFDELRDFNHFQEVIESSNNKMVLDIEKEIKEYENRKKN